MNKKTMLNRWTLGLAAVGLVSLGSVAQAQTTNAPAPGGTNAAPASKDGFFTRFDKAFREQLGTPAYVPPGPPDTNAPPAQRRGNPSPFDSPPYCTGEWQIGGTPIIGDPNALPLYPLTQALYGGPGGPWLQDHKIFIYGWEDFSGNISSSHNNTKAQGANFPLIYDQQANTLVQNQFAFFVERDPDEFQQDHIDWGFRYSFIYGEDYRYMISRGLFSNQLITRVNDPGQPTRNNWYGYDMPMVYANIYIPRVADGLNFTIGRIISEADIEAQLAPNNLMSSHSLLYSFDPYTQEGIFGTLKLDNCWTVQAGLANGNDVAIWQNDPGNTPTGTIMLQYQSPNNKFSFYGGANSLNAGGWGYNNIQQYVGTLSYKFNETIWTTHETWYMFQHNAPTLAQASANGTLTPQPVNAFYPTTQNGFNGGYAPEWATLNYTQFRLGPSTFLSIRNELFDDIVGQRTGDATLYSEHSIGITWWPCRLITVRPEVRFEHNYGGRGNYAYDNGLRHSQFTMQADVIVRY
jgi:Putative beta-barrel porin-2, OmpL-like. bbp2